MRTRGTLFTFATAALVLAVGPGAVAADAGAEPDRDLVLPATSRPLEDAAGVHATSSPPGGLARAFRDVLAGREVRLPAGSDAPAQTLSASSVTTQPTFASPSAGETVTGELAVTVKSEAAQVRIAALGVEQIVPVDATGHATVTVATWGWSGAVTLAAADCIAPGDCGTPAEITVSVDNPAPTLTRPTAGSTVGTSFTAAATTPGGGVAFTIDGRRLGFVGSAPYEQQLYTDGLTSGTHTLAVVQCDAAGLNCDEAKPSASIEIIVRQHLYPTIDRIAPNPFSPGRDGRRDTATVTYRLDTAQTVAWRVTNAAGVTVVPARGMGTKAAGSYQLTFDGKRPDGRYLPTGRYTVHLDTTKTTSGSQITGHAMRGVTVDRTGPRVAYAKASPATVFPVRDRYKDATWLKGRLSERVVSAQIRIFNSAGRVVRRLAIGARSAGPVAVQWNGRRASGALVDAGTYRYRYYLQDVAGNRSVSGKYTVEVSHKRLVKKSGSKTVTAKGSAVRVYEGDCSEVIGPGVRGWANSVGYYSNLYYTDPDFYGCWYSGGYELASVDHATTLPSAIRYGSMRISAYGGKALPKFDDVAVLLYYTGDGDLSKQGRVLGSAVGDHSGPTVDKSFISAKGRVRWSAGTIDGNFYDIKSFTVHFTYFVLR